MRLELILLIKNSYREELNHKVLFFGDGSSKFKSVINNSNAFFIDDIYPYADNMAELSMQKYHKNEFEDVAYFEPLYLKDFVIGKKI